MVESRQDALSLVRELREKLTGIYGERLEGVYHHAGVRLFADRSRSDYLAKPGGTREDAERDLAIARDFVVASRGFLEKRETGGSSEPARH